MNEIHSCNQKVIDKLEAENKRLRDAIKAICFMVDAQAEDEVLWSTPWEGSQPISEAYLQQELRRLHECIEHYAQSALGKGEK